MARISTYAKDTQVTADDKVIGSSYEGMVNGRPQFVTRNFTVSNLAEYFSQHITVGGTEYSIPELFDKVENLQDMFTYDNILEDVTGFSTAFLGFFNTSFDTRLSNKTTDDLDEGSNLYYTQERFDTAFGLKTTDDLDEGTTNLYFTTERAQDAINDLFVEGTGITLTYDDEANTFTVSTTITQYTDELARLAISYTDTGGFGSLTYDDVTGVITYTGPSTQDIRDQFTEGAGIDIVDGQISVDTTIVQPDKHDSLIFTSQTFGSPANTELFDGVTYVYLDFEHNLGKYPSVTVTEGSNPDRVCFVPVKYIDNNTVRVYFRGTTSGTIYVN